MGTPKRIYFGLGEKVSEKDSNLKIENLSQEKLKKAPIHNLSSEWAVGSVNYGLQVYGSKQLKLVSSSLVKASSSELLKGEKVTSEMRNLVKKGGKISQILEAWEKKQKELTKKGMDAKDVANTAADKQKMQDLATLVASGGPFTSAHICTHLPHKSSYHRSPEE